MDFDYSPSIAVARSARSFMRTLCEHYGTQKGMEVWEYIRAGLGDEIAGDIFLGCLQGESDIKVLSVDADRRIEAIKEIRHATGWTLKVAKEFTDNVWNLGPQVIKADQVGSDIGVFVDRLVAAGCTIG